MSSIQSYTDYLIQNGVTLDNESDFATTYSNRRAVTTAVAG